MRARGEQWLDEEAGPIVRPYALIRGRTRSSGDNLDLIAMVTATGSPYTGEAGLVPEEHRILELADRPMSVADIASEIDLPLGVVRVLLGDLQDKGMISVRAPAHEAGPRPNERILKEVINGLRAL
ncbi:hypothetical protein Sme01_33210 [Sphaerisporangium melleum]|uniref:DUF742 domain-containing protein n=1 Tax=Sphaerisporangium melleum TaxID=321316 RepID=A0A917QXM5_9ACTN|nr:DUF742 domain-containing protein [Sphaerisporangium melleum]GGK73895.1 hypothetical protein GCM10007964_15870 [Sphaerisporangium melleum]GII70845.1 hypothetical protein Sme01_33210 [Sphaerisporangium melleum]